MLPKYITLVLGLRILLDNWKIVHTARIEARLASHMQVAGRTIYIT